MRKWNLAFQIEPSWRVVLVEQVDESAIFVVTIEKGDGSGRRWNARFDLDKGVFLDHLPITIDSGSIRNVIRGLVQR